MKLVLFSMILSWGLQATTITIGFSGQQTTGNELVATGEGSMVVAGVNGDVIGLEQVQSFEFTLTESDPRQQVPTVLVFDSLVALDWTLGQGNVPVSGFLLIGAIAPDGDSTGNFAVSTVNGVSEGEFDWLHGDVSFVDPPDNSGVIAIPEPSYLGVIGVILVLLMCYWCVYHTLSYRHRRV